MNEGPFIPQANPGLQYRRLKSEIDLALHRVLESGRYILGPEVEAFEREFAAFCGAGHAVGLASGTDAIRMALWALNLGPDAEVIAPAHTAVATIAAIERAGVRPVLADVDPVTYALDPGSAVRAITSRTRAIVPVHLYGHPADMDALLELGSKHGLAIIEDCAQAHGATWRGRPVGALGTIGCFSFYPTKNLAALGDGGAIVTNDPALADRVRLLREYGWKTRYVSAFPGDSCRLDELQAAVLRVRLRHLSAEIEERRRLATLFTEGLRGAVTTPAARDEAVHAYHLYVIETDGRDRVQEYLRRQGIGTLVHYPWPVHLQPAYLDRLGVRGSFPAAERACTRVLSLPLYPGLTPDQVERIVMGATEAAGMVAA